nr:MAG TPA: hypothetical protein [Caudoviricetes sp.]
MEKSKLTTTTMISIHLKVDFSRKLVNKNNLDRLIFKLVMH